MTHCCSSSRASSCSALVRRASTSAFFALKSARSMASPRYAASHRFKSLSHWASWRVYCWRSQSRSACWVLAPSRRRSNSSAMRVGSFSARSTASQTTGSIAVACTLRRKCGATQSWKIGRKQRYPALPLLLSDPPMARPHCPQRRRPIDKEIVVFAIAATLLPLLDSADLCCLKRGAVDNRRHRNRYPFLPWQAPPPGFFIRITLPRQTLLFVVVHRAEIGFIAEDIANRDVVI